MSARYVLAVALLALSGPAQSAAPRYCVLVVEEIAGGLAILSPDGSPRARVPLGERPHELAVSTDGRTAFVAMFGIADYNNRLGTPGPGIARIDLRSARETGRFLLPPGRLAPHGVQLRPGRARELFTNSEVGGDHMIVFDIATGKVQRQFPLPDKTHNFVFSRDGDTLYSFAGKGGVTRLDATTGKTLATIDIGSPARGVRLLGSDELAVSGKGEIVVLDAATLTVRRRITAPVAGQLAYLETFPDGSIAAPSLGDGGVVLVDRAGNASFVATGNTALVVRRAPDGKTYVSNVLDDHLSIVDREAGTAQAIARVAGANGIGFGSCPR